MRTLSKIAPPSRAAWLVTALVLGACGRTEVDELGAAEEKLEAPGYSAHFNSPSLTGAQSLTLETTVKSLVEAAPAGSTIHLSIYSWTRAPMADIFIAAFRRGVDVRFIIGKDEFNTTAVKKLRAAIPPDRFTFCGLNTTYNSCIAASGSPINHNKFILFSELSDGSKNVVVQSSANFTVNMLTTFNNLVVAKNAPTLYAAYLKYWSDLKAQVKANNYYPGPLVAPSASLYTFPRATVAALSTAQTDTVAELLSRYSCPSGGSVRLAQLFFNKGRSAVAEQLARLRREGCAVEAILNAGEAMPLAILKSAGATVIPFHDDSTATGADVGVHHKYFLVDATTNQARSKRVFTGSHNLSISALRENDESLLEIDDAAVFDAFTANFNGMKAIAVHDPAPATDKSAPYTASFHAPSANAAGWINSAVTVNLDAADATDESGVKEIVVSFSGAQTGQQVFPGDRASVVVSANGETTLTYFARDNAGNTESAKTLTLRVDTLPPAITGLPPSSCALWEPDRRMVTVGTAVGTDNGASIPVTLTVTSSDPEKSLDPADLYPDIVTSGNTISLRAERFGYVKAGRTYYIRAFAVDAAGNSTTVNTRCTVAHDASVFANSQSKQHGKAPTNTARTMSKADPPQDPDRVAEEVDPTPYNPDETPDPRADVDVTSATDDPVAWEAAASAP